MRTEQEIKKRIDEYVYISKSNLKERDRGHAADKAALLYWVLEY